MLRVERCGFFVHLKLTFPIALQCPLSGMIENKHNCVMFSRQPYTNVRNPRYQTEIQECELQPHLSSQIKSRIVVIIVRRKILLCFFPNSNHPHLNNVHFTSLTSLLNAPLFFSQQFIHYLIPIILVSRFFYSHCFNFLTATPRPHRPRPLWEPPSAPTYILVSSSITNHVIQTPR